MDFSDSYQASRSMIDRGDDAGRVLTPWWKIVPVVCVIWMVFVVLAGVANFFDLRMLGMNASISGQVYLFLALLSTKVMLSCYLAVYFERHQDEALRARNLFRIFFYLMFVFLPLSFCGEGVFIVARRGEAPISWSSVVEVISPLALWMDMVLVNFAYSMQLAYSFWRKNQRRFLEAQVARQHYLQLRMQQLQGKLEPYFLLSSLEDITDLVISAEPQLATKALARLSELLRHVLDSTDDDWRSVEDELQVLQDYLALQNLRFGDRLRIEWRGRERTWSSIACPPMLFLPLLDAAVRACAERLQTESQEIIVQCERDGGNFILTITLSTFLASFGQITPALVEVNERVRLAFGNAAYCDERVILGPAGRQLALVLSFPAREREDD
ncbi:histidine kinase [Undibacterium cyanobacteriorum]|uniref:Histidine kinase n=1 Tax=Undibacterium cyanobacteriorum TaxID=3073561 RepID=A0ABY9RIY6_9BURK|nr:histidine kinase [Undibacterium sp. 20NA77.5]WMW80881.1 histidine kinase [Undibacterium sp. 20NA77.5]